MVPVSLRNPSLPSRRSIRLQGYDYSQSGAFFVTICTYQNACLFGEIRDGKMTVNNLGLIVTDCWSQITQVRPNVELDAFILMPNHLHGILFIFDKNTADVATRPKRTANDSESRLASGSLGVIIGQFKRAVTIRSKLLNKPPEQAIWQRNYYEHIVRNERSLDDIRKYIVENPGKWLDDSLYVQ